MPLNAQALEQCHTAVRSRQTALSTLCEKAEERAKQALLNADRATINQVGRQLVVLERERDLLGLVDVSLARLRTQCGALLAATDAVPPDAAASLGVIALAADACPLPQLTSLRSAIYAHYHLNVATQAPFKLPGGGAGPGETELLRGIAVPQTMVELFDPRFQKPLPAAVKKRLIELVDALAAAKKAEEEAAAARGAAAPSKIASFPSTPTSQPRLAASHPQAQPPQQQHSTGRINLSLASDQKHPKVQASVAPEDMRHTSAGPAKHHESEEERGSTSKTQRSSKGGGFFGLFKKRHSHTTEHESPTVSPKNKDNHAQTAAPAPAPAAAKAEPEEEVPAAPTPESGETVAWKNSDVEVSPVQLSFGTSSRQAPVETELVEELTVRNPHKATVYVELARVANERQDYKYSVEFRPRVAFAVGGGECRKASVVLRILCTTKLEVEFGVRAWKDKAKRYKEARLCFATESQLTTRLDPEELKREDVIGDGAYGAVYSGTYRGMDVAIKVLKHQEYVTDEMKAEFASEVDMMEKLRHSAILNFVGAVHIPGQLAIVTELCPFGSLFSAMNKYRADFSPALKAKCLLDAANGMDFLHQSGIIHRDLKPDNLLMVSLEPRASIACKLSDFGTTRDVNCFAAKMQSTKGVGTPLFMAPEIFAGKQYDKSVDVYSFSFIIYVVYAEQLPFEGDPVAATPWAYADAIKSGKRPGVPPACPPEVAQVMQRAWDDDPARRPGFEEIHTFFRAFFKKTFATK